MTAFEDLLTWRESSTSGEAIRAALVAAADGAGVRAGDLLAAADRIVVTGAGSSYYLAQAAASVAQLVLRRPVIAAPLSELLLRPDGVVVGDEPIVVISRSGATSEAVSVAARMRAAGHQTIALTCRAGSPLAKTADVTLVAAAGDEAAIVMTRSFASMLALIESVAAMAAADEVLVRDLDQIPERFGEAAAAAALGRRLGMTDWSRIVILGGGPSFGIAAEWGLKLTETSQVATLAYQPFEFRHGPISVCEPGMLVIGLVGGPGAAEEAAVVAEAARLGASTWLVARTAEEARAVSGDVSLIGGGLDPWARLPLLAHPAHALACSLALTRGLDPDVPRHLDQVVILGS